jgi:hypothetical protein
MKTQPDFVDLIIAYESGDLSDYEMVNLFDEPAHGKVRAELF